MDSRFREIPTYLSHKLAKDADCWLWQVDRFGHFTYSNGQVERFLGYTADDILTTNLSDILSPRTSEESRVALTAPFQIDHDILDVKNWKIGRDGQEQLFSTDIFPERDVRGNVIGICGVDYPEPETRDRLHQLDELKCRQLSEMLGLPAGATALDGKILWVNNDFCTYFGYSESELIGADINAISAPELPEPEQPQAVMSALLETGNIKRFVHRKKKSGKLVSLLLHATVIRDDHGKPDYIFGFYSDLADFERLQLALDSLQSKHAELFDKLRQTNDELLQAQRVGRIGSWKMDTESGHVTWSEELYRMFGMPPGSEAPNYAAQEKLFTPESWRKLDNRLTRTIQEGEPYELELQLSAEFGENSWMLARCEPIKDSQGRVTKLRGVAMDISGRKQSELQLKEKANELMDVLFRTVDMVSSLDEIRDPYTAGHEKRVAQLADAIAEEMQLPNDRRQGLVIASQLHDIGKLACPSEILTKPTRLSEIEFAIVKTHSEVGHRVLEVINFPWPVAEVAYQHHERLDGSGYPQGLKGDEIILEARIVAVADVVESMASHRPYRPALGIDAALEEIERGRGTIYDPEAVDACLRLFREDGFRLPNT